MSRPRIAFAIVAFICVFATIPSSGLAAAGDLDLAFGAGGKVTTAIGTVNDSVGAVAVQADGKIVAVGRCRIGANDDFCLARYNADGSLDASFDGDGKVTTAVGADFDLASAVVVQGSGKIVAIGDCTIGSSIDFCLARYNADGSLDPSFDGDGKLSTSIGAGADRVHAAAVQGDGKIVVAGNCIVAGTFDFCLARYNADGTLDSSFDGDGKVITAIGTHDDFAHGVAVRGDGKIVAAGYCTSATPPNVFCLARYNADGSLDASFDGDGKVTTAVAMGQGDAAFAVAFQGDGRIVAAGECVVGPKNLFCLARYNDDGSLDASFDGDGKVTTTLGPGSDIARAVAVQGDGGIVAAGYCWPGPGLGSEDFCLARYDSNGSLDTSFSDDGKVITSFGTGFDQALALAVQADSRIVAVGGCVAGPATVFCLARYEAGPTPAPPSNLTATALSRSQIGLSWTDNASDETLFRIERSLDGSGGWRQVATVGANATAYTHSRQPPLTTFFYRVRATNRSGDSSPSNVDSATTLGWRPSSAPTAPQPGFATGLRDPRVPEPAARPH